MKKIFLILVAFVGLTVLTNSATTSETQSLVSPLDPKVLEGRWEGTMQQSMERHKTGRFPHYYALEIFFVDVDNKKIFARQICEGERCGRQGAFYLTSNLSDEKDKIVFETTEKNPIAFILKGDYLNGSRTVVRPGVTIHYDFTLKRIHIEKRIFKPEELIGRWVWSIDEKWWELTITDTDTQNKTFKGKYMFGSDKSVHEIQNAKMVVEDGVLKIEFKTFNGSLHYRLKYHSNFGDYPPVLWGKLDESDGKSTYPMFRKLEKKD